MMMKKPNFLFIFLSKPLSIGEGINVEKPLPIFNRMCKFGM
jgi:hypothetical protein